MTLSVDCDFLLEGVSRMHKLSRRNIIEAVAAAA
jgi:hypothetical protein